MDDRADDDVMILCGRDVRESRRSCAFCANRAIVQCDGTVASANSATIIAGRLLISIFARRVSINFCWLPRPPEQIEFFPVNDLCATRQGHCLVLNVQVGENLT
jgi:hypothetical protein